MNHRQYYTPTLEVALRRKDELEFYQGRGIWSKDEEGARNLFYCIKTSMVRKKGYTLYPEIVNRFALQPIDEFEDIVVYRGFISGIEYRIRLENSEEQFVRIECNGKTLMFTQQRLAFYNLNKIKTKISRWITQL